MSARPDPVEDASLVRSTTTWQAVGAALGLLLVAAFPAYRAVEAGRREAALEARQAALVVQGRKLWVQNCSTCHGVNGEGVDAPALNSRQFLQQVTDEQMHSIVAVGIPGSEMPAWWNEIGGPFTDEQIAAVVAYVRSWEPTAPDRPDWRTPGGEERGHGDHTAPGT